MKEIILTKETVQQIADELDKYDIIMSVVTEDDNNLGKQVQDYLTKALESQQALSIQQTEL